MTAQVSEVRERYDSMAEAPVAQLLEGLLLLAGLYLLLSPWLAGGAGAPGAALDGATVSGVVVGAAVALMAAGFASAYATTHRIAWTMPVLGVWVIVSPWLVAGQVPGSLVLSNIIIGAVIVLAGIGILRPTSLQSR